MNQPYFAAAYIGALFATQLSAPAALALTQFTPNTPISSTDMNQNFTELKNACTTIAGDLSGPLSAAKVTRLQGVAVSPTGPTLDKQFLGYNLANQDWEPTTFPSGMPVTSAGVAAAGGITNDGGTVANGILTLKAHSGFDSLQVYDSSNHKTAYFDGGGNLNLPGSGGDPSNVQLGSGALASASSSLAIGNSAAAQGQYSIALGESAQAGQGSIVIGHAASSASHSNSIVLGTLAQATATNQLVAGSANFSISDIYFGTGASGSAPGNAMIHGTSATSGMTSVVGADIGLQGGNSGIGNTGGFVIARGATASAPGNLDLSGGIPAAGNVGGSINFVTKGTLGQTSKMSVGPEGVGIGLTTPTAPLDIVGLFRVRPQPSGTAPNCSDDGLLALTYAHVLCVCNGSVWVRTADGTTSCTF